MWDQQWRSSLTKGTRMFRFGDGKACPSLGTIIIHVVIPAKYTRSLKPVELNIQADVVDSRVPLLISKRSLVRLKASIEFPTNTLSIPNASVITLITAGSGHLQLPAGRISILQKGPQSSLCPIYPVNTNPGNDVMSFGELRKIHLRLGRCSEFTLRNMLQAAKVVVPDELITRVPTRCTCAGKVNRVTPPEISPWVAKFNGEIVGLDVVYPFVGSRAEKTTKTKTFGIPALMMVCCLTRFCARSLLIDLKPKTVSEVFMDHWVRFVGKPRRLIMDGGSPGLVGKEWDRLSHVFCFQMINAPARAPNQNGMLERSFRNLKIAVRAILSDPSMKPGQSVLTLASIARNHVPHSATGIPPALAMTGRADLMDGAASTIFDHDPISGDIIVKQQNGIRNIPNARNAIIMSSARQALKTCINRQLPDRSRTFLPIGSTVQIADHGKWIGSYRVIAHASSNLILERGRYLFKWPKTKCRRVIGQDEDQMEVISDVEDNDEQPAKIAIQSDPIMTGKSPDHKITAARASHDVPPDQSDEEYWLDAIQQGEIYYYSKPTRPTYTFGTLLTSSSCLETCPTLIDHHYLQPCMIEDDIPCPHSFVFTTTADHDFMNSASKTIDQEILDKFGPSRIPPRIAFQSPQSRLAIGKEITDLLTPHGKIPPAILEIDLSDSRYCHLPRVFSTIIVKRKSIDLYKGRICTRGDLVPLANVAFVSSPTANRCCVRIVITIAPIMAWGIKALDISQAFLQADNLNERDRIVIIPPPMIVPPWKGRLPPSNCDLRTLPPTTRGILLIRPLYGGRGAPMRWFLAFSQRLRDHGYRQLKSDVCVFTKYAEDSQHTGRRDRGTCGRCVLRRNYSISTSDRKRVKNL